MKISILTATYNRAKLLERLYKSIVKNLSDAIEVEWLIMDDGSIDETQKTVEKFIKDNKFDIQYYSQENSGKMSAINKLVPYSTGDLIIECDSDDYFKQNAFNIIKSNYNEIDEDTYALCYLKYDQNECNIGNLFKQKETTIFDLYFKQNNFAMGTNLQRLEIGSNVAGYENPNLESLTIGNNKMLEYLDVRNCPNVSGALDLSGCISLRELYLENTNFTGISIAKGGLLETAHLDSPTSISMMELIYVNDLKLESANNLTTLRIENYIFAPTATLTIGSTVTTQATKDIVLNLIDSSNNLSRVRLVGVNWILPNTDVLDRALNFAGIDDDSFDIRSDFARRGKGFACSGQWS